MRIPHGSGPGFGLYSIFADVVAGLGFIIGLAVVVGLIVLLVRFLLIATKAAELYVANNRPLNPTAATPPASTASTTAPPMAATTPVVPPAPVATTWREVMPSGTVKV